MQKFFCTSLHRKEGAVGGWRRQIERRSVKSIKRGGRSENVIMSDGRLDCKLKITEYAEIYFVGKETLLHMTAHKTFQYSPRKIDQEKCIIQTAPRLMNVVWQV